MDTCNKCVSIRIVHRGIQGLVNVSNFDPFFADLFHITIEVSSHFDPFFADFELSSICWRLYPQYLGDVQVGHLPTPEIA